ncbi:sister chromatid cohesion protein DCC1 isoform X2 [Schistocerca nitens]|uniref:sister chromatid cohesion protein DCC1 isoform X2 n=1 Tax=Schistocerca nitens TaxID=7011 RepID=UPI00211868FD|nr:sister chromatid cohesion protein DCC1 isoform X2 [Schistocerca nitens]
MAETVRYERTIDEIRTVIHHAKLEESELLPVTQILNFASRSEAVENYRLFQLDTKLLNTLEEGDSLVLRGGKEESAVLCTQNKTFEIKEAETSNSMLLLPGISWSHDADIDTEDRILDERQVLGVFYKYFELHPSKPKLKKLYQLLKEAPYRGPELEDELEGQLYTFDDLLEHVQASGMELKAALQEMQAVCIKGNPLYKLREREVCRFLAEVLLRPAGQFNLQDFMLAWGQCVPEGMETKVEYLDGIALMQKDCKPEVIWHFPEVDLPEDINERFRILFQTRERWTLNEIYPYIERVATEKMNVNAVLTKHARASTVGGVKCYSAKHAK